MGDVIEKSGDEMWLRASSLTRVVASCVKVSEAAGSIIKGIMSGGDLGIVNKCKDGGQADLQTEADRAAQYCIEKSLQEKFENKLNIFGEEEVTSIVPNKELGFSNEVLSCESRMPSELKAIKEEDLVIWVDPLDGTSEFAAASKGRTPNLQQVTVLIGICYKGRAIAGVIHQPYFLNNEGRTIWGIVGVGAYGFETPPHSTEKVVVTTRSHSTELVQSALKALKEKQLADRVDIFSGAGYKVLKCLEGSAAYVFASAGCKKWDTAAPEAVLIAAGGMLTDISGRRIDYTAGVQFQNTGGVLATAHWIKHQDYVDAIPEDVKRQLPEFAAKK